ncbi:MAG TPA: hypothetical protein PLA82_11200 [Deltaproteobacteria bacterium]|nr:hypothetical protein [Deltaproteobacteria bacterium]
MKKLCIIVAVAVFVILPLVHLLWGVFENDWTILPLTRSKKTVEITEISEKGFTQDMLKGQWVLYLYYPNVTRTLELMIDGRGAVKGRTEGIEAAMAVAIGQDGSLELSGPSLSLKGSMDKSREHLDGMAIVKDASSPIPFSCFKIGGHPATQ